ENMADRDKMREIMSQVRKLAIADGQRAVSVVRQRALEWGIDPDRIGLIGFSAGGAVASGVALRTDVDSRPDFVAPIYGAPWDDIAVPTDAPPMFLALASDDDMAVRTSVPLYSKWREAGRSVELHIFSKGGHGFGMRKQGLPSDRWIDLLGDWLGVQGLLELSNGKSG
ncbi:MAG TPA: alpha/beta hydrolase, partial [Chloroflexota bacterium]|nr:alpha/beta hydrolase [Chloroflexota bacterium]